MKRGLRIASLVGLLLALAAAWPAWRIYDELRKAGSEDPTVWEEDILAFEQAARDDPPPRDAVLFVGSSSIRLWSTLARDMQPFPVIQRGFGGAKIGDVVHYAERLINVNRPRAVVVFVGSNDIVPDAAKRPEVVLASWRELVARIRADLPEVPIYYISITPTPLRWAVEPLVRETNELIRADCEQEPGLEFIETSSEFITPDGGPDEDLFAIDGLHLNERGYAIWTRIIRGRLLEDLG